MRRPDGPATPHPPAWRRWAPWLAFGAAIAATAVLVVARGEDLAALAALGAAEVVALVLLQVVYLVIQSGRFHVVLLRFAERPIGFGPWLQLFVLGRFLNLFLPQAGNVYRAVELRRRHGVRYQSFVVAFVNAPWLAMVMNFAFGAVTVGLLRPAAAVAGWPLWLLLAGAAALAASAPVVALGVLRLVPRGWRPLAWLHARLREMVAVTWASLGDGAYLLRVAAWTLLAFVQATALLWFGFAALGSEVGLAEAVAFYVLLQLATYLPITPGNLGVQELAFGALAAGFGAAAVDGVVVSGLLRVTGVVAIVATGLPLGGVAALREARVAARAAPPAEDRGLPAARTRAD